MNHEASIAASERRPWPLVPLSEICEPNIPTRDPRTRPDDSFVYVDISSVDNELKTVSSPSTCFGRDAPSRARLLIRANDVLVATTRPNLNAVAMIGPELDLAICSTGFCVLRAADRIDPRYLFAFVQSPGFVNSLAQMVKGALYPAVTNGQVMAECIPLPPRELQAEASTRISAQLEQLKIVRAATFTRRSTAHKLPAALLRSVFNPPDNAGWPRARLREVSELRPSKSIASDGNTVVSAITTACLSESGFLSAGLKSARMWAGDAEECVVEAGEILVARSNTAELVGRAALFNGEAEGVVASDLTIRIWPGPRCHPPFLAGYLSYLYQTGYWIDRAGGASGSMKKITRSQIVELEIPLPPLDDQRAISSRLSGQMETVGRLRNSLNHELAAINKLPDAILCQAFGGGI